MRQCIRALITDVFGIFRSSLTARGDCEKTLNLVMPLHRERFLSESYLSQCYILIRLFMDIQCVFFVEVLYTQPSTENAVALAESSSSVAIVETQKNLHEDYTKSA